jgi:fructose-1,6-bisphosphatase/inositol monophosphatase family enzyme
MPGPSDHALAVTLLMREAMMSQIVPFYGKLRPDQVSDNGFKDVATVADRQAESFLSRD